MLIPIPDPGSLPCGMQVLGILEQRSGEDSFKRILEGIVSQACRALSAGLPSCSFYDSHPAHLPSSLKQLVPLPGPFHEQGCLFD